MVHIAWIIPKKNGIYCRKMEEEEEEERGYGGGEGAGIGRGRKKGRWVKEREGERRCGNEERGEVYGGKGKDKIKTRCVEVEDPI